MILPILITMYRISAGYIAGSRIDWISQHTVFPDYFRQLFYETGNMLPQYALELGGGQNIYNFAYYGLFNPLFLPSYLLPFMKMTTYVEVMMTIVWIADGILAFLWLKKHVEEKYAFAGAIFLIGSVAVVYHTAAQIMFVDYIPFLLLCLMGCDAYIEKKKCNLLMVSITLMILTSFYYAIGGILVVEIYLFSRWKVKLGVNRRTSLEFWKMLYPILLSIGAAAFYLVPVFCTMQGGRSDKPSFSIFELVTPDISLTKFLYHPYGMGLSIVAIVALLYYSLQKELTKKKLAIMVVIVTVIPIFSWALNGGLYIRDKSLIPILPLMIFFIASFLETIEKKEWEHKALVDAVILTVLVVAIEWKQFGGKQFLFIDVSLILILLGVTISSKFRYFLRFGTLIFFACISFVQQCNTMSQLTDVKTEQKIYNKDTENVVKNLVSQKENYRIEQRGDSAAGKTNMNRVLSSGQNITTVYSSIENAYYQKFRKEIGLAQSSRNKLVADSSYNPLFLRFMGVKYLVGKPSNIDYISTKNANVIENTKTAPMFYLTNQTMAYQAYKNLPWYQKQIALMQTAVTNQNNQSVELKSKEVAMEIPEYQGTGGSVTWKREMLEVSLKKAVLIEIPLSANDKISEYLFTEMSVENKKNQDITIALQGEKNRLSSKNSNYYNGNENFHFTTKLDSNHSSVMIRLGAGTYNLKDIHFYAGQINEEANTMLYSHPVLMNRQDDYKLTGEYFNMTYSWFITSLPYDSGYKIMIDGKEMKTKIVNGGFLGTDVPAGKHEIRVEYHTPGRTFGGIVTMISLLVMLGIGVGNGKIYEKIS